MGVCRPKSSGRRYYDDDTGSPSSDSTVLGPRRFGTSDRRLAQCSRIDLDSRSSEILRHPKMDYIDAPSTHYLSPSSLGSPVTTRLEAFSPMLSPVRENKSVEESWRNDSFYLVPLPQAQENNFDLYKKPVPRLSSPSQKRSLACLPGSPGAIGQKSSIPPRIASRSPLPKSRGSNSRDKVVPSGFPLSPMKGRGFVETLKGRSRSGPTNLAGGSRVSGSRGTRMAPFRSPRTTSAGAVLGWSSSERRRGALKLDAARGRFQSLESRTPTPTGRVVDDDIVRQRHQSLEMGARSSYFSVETLMIAAPKPSVTQNLRGDPSTPQNKATTRKIYQTPGVVHPPSYDDFYSSPEQRNARFSITPGLLSTLERKSKGLTEVDIYQESLFQREDSTVFSTATNSTGGISNLAAEMASISSARRVPRAPKLIEVVKNVSGGSAVIPVGEGYGRPGTVGDAGTVIAVSSVKLVDMAGKEGTEICPLVVSGFGKRVDPTTKRAGSHGSTSKIPSARGYTKRNSSYGSDPKAREVRRDTGEYLEFVQKRPGKDMGLGDSKTGEVSKAMMVSTSPKMVAIGAGQKPTNGRLSTGQQRSTTEGHTGAINFERSHQRTPGGGFAAPDLGGRIRRGSTAGTTGKSYMRPLAKNAPFPPHKNHSSGALSIISNKSSTRIGGGNKDAEQALPGRKNTKSIDSTKIQGIFSAVGSKNGSKASIAAIDAQEELGRNKRPEIIVHTAGSPSGYKNSSSNGVLVDITSIGYSSNPRTTPISGRWFGRRGTEIPTVSRPITISGPINDDTQKENHRPIIGGGEQYPQPQGVTPKPKSGTLGNLTNWLSSGRKSKGKSSPPPPNGRFSPDEVESLIKRLSTQIPQTPDQKNGFRVLGGRYYSLNIPSLDKSPSKDEKDRNPIAVCMDLINTASNEPQSDRRESLLQMSRIMVDIVSKSRDAECAAEEAKLAAKRAEVAFLETRKYLVEVTELMGRKKREI